MPSRLVVLRMGSTTVCDNALSQACERAYANLGVYAFSVFEVPGNDFEALARLVPIVLSRPKVLEASGPELLAAGFPLLPTATFPHWSIVLSEPTSAQFARVRALFRVRSTTPSGLEGRASMACVTARADLVFDPNDVGPDCVVECWISQGPRAEDPLFDPRAGDRLTVVDEDGESLQGRVTRRDANRVWVQVEIPGLLIQTA